MSKLQMKRRPRRIPRLVAPREISPAEKAQRQAELAEFDRRCYHIFASISPELMAEHYNWFILIEPETGEYFMDEDELVAFQKAREKHPQGKFFFYRLNETGVSGRI
ncbi:MAG: hypothetical protein AB4352_17715 [Hormoscilla sp.]